MTEQVRFDGELRYGLKNYIDLAVRQTLADAAEAGGLGMAEVPLFKGGQKTKSIDRLEVPESLMVSLLHGTEAPG